MVVGGTVVVGRTAVVVVGGAALVVVVERSVATDGDVSDPVVVLLHDAPIAANPMSVMKICRRMFLREGIMIDMCGGRTDVSSAGFPINNQRSTLLTPIRLPLGMRVQEQTVLLLENPGAFSPPHTRRDARRR